MAEDGRLVERYTYDAYGRTHIERLASGNLTFWPAADPNNAPFATSGFDNPWLWTGQRYDPAPQLYHFLYRTYSPRLGRWLQHDPAGYVDGVNLYEYVSGMAFGAVDPLGLSDDLDLDTMLASGRAIGRLAGTPAAVKNLNNAGAVGNTVQELNPINSAGEFITGTDWQSPDPANPKKLTACERLGNLAEIAPWDALVGLGAKAVNVVRAARGAEAIADTARVVNKVDELVEVAYDTGNVAKAAEFADGGAGAAKIGDAAADTGRTCERIADTAESAGDLSRRAPIRGAAAEAEGAASAWTRAEINGTRVYQRTDLINPDLVDSLGRSNLQRMQKGLAPIGPDGNPMNLHHMLQTADSPLAEMTQTFHQDYSSVIHINPNTIPSGINRAQFNAWRGQYWINRANDFLPR